MCIRLSMLIRGPGVGGVGGHTTMTDITTMAVITMAVITMADTPIRSDTVMAGIITRAAAFNIGVEFSGTGSFEGVRPGREPKNAAGGYAK